MLTTAFVTRFVDEWIAAWNAHDLDRILSHYADDFEMTSPFIVQLMGESTGTLRGKAAVRAYWAKALEKFPDLQFELLDVCFSVETVAIYYRSVLNRRAVEWFWFDPGGKVRKAIGHYNEL
jgi:ketosteroid isomerase-like protein